MKNKVFKRVNQYWRLLGFMSICLIIGVNVYSQSFLSASGIKIVNASGQTVLLRGVNLGNWVLHEGWMISNDGNNPGTQSEMKKILYDRGFTDAQVETFYQGWRNNFVTKADIDYLASKGFNSVRLPMHYDLFLTPTQRAVRNSVIRDKSKYDNYKTQLASWVAANTIATDYTVEGYKVIDNLISWCAANNMYVILDMHAVPGSQGTDEHIADCIKTPNDLWNSTVNQDVLNAMWKNISLRYKNNATVAMYDLINEPNNIPSAVTMKNVYQRLITTIRNNGDNHILLLEGDGWGNKYNENTPDKFTPRTNLAYNIHRYDFDGWACPTSTTAKDPGNNPNQIQYLGTAQDFRNTYNVPIYCGETGLRNYTWMKENTQSLELLGMGWAIWSYKWHTGMSYDYGCGAIPGINPSEIYTSADMTTVLENIKFSNMTKNTNPGFWDALFPVPATPVAVTGVSVSPATATVNTSLTVQLTATISPANATNKNVTWSSNNTAVATVNASGLVSGVAAGTATITVTTQDGSKKATSTITVVTPVQEPYSGTAITIPGTVEAENYDKGGQNLAYNDNEAANQGNQYRTSEGVDIESCTEGGYDVGWTAAGEWIEYTVNVGSAGNYDISARVASEAGGTFRIEFNNTDKTGTLTVPNTGGWQAWQNVTKTGVSLSAGTQVMKVYIISGSFNLNKITFTRGQANVAVTGVTLSPTTLAIKVNATSTLTATVAPSNATNKAVTWTSSNTAVAIVSTTGVVTGKAAGTATITVKTTDGNKTATCSVTVSNVAVTGVSVSPTSASIAKGSTQQLTATVAPANATNKTVSWTSSNTSVATVNASGLVTAVAIGTATISVKTQDGNKTATCAVTVTAAATFPGYYNIISVFSAKALDVKDLSTASGASIQQWDLSTTGGGANQRWRLDDAGSGNYYIKVKSTQMCLALQSTSTADGIKVIQQTCNSSSSQKWTLTNLGSGVYKITNVYSGKALDVTDVSNANGALIQVWTYNGGTNQQWTINQVEATKAGSISENMEGINTSFAFFPNPAVDNITVRQGRDIEVSSVEIYSLSGQLVLKHQAVTDGATLNISHLNSGVYYVKANSSKGIIYSKLVKR